MNSSKCTSMVWSAGRTWCSVGAAAQHELEPVGPVVADPLDVNPVTGEACSVGEHHHHRRRHRDRVAVRDHEGGVGERVDQRRELLEVLG